MPRSEPRDWPSLTAAVLFVACAPPLGACSVGAPTAHESPEEAAPVVASAAGAARAAGYRYHAAPGPKLRFPVLRAGVRVEERRFDPNLPAYKFRHSIEISTEAGPAVILEVWDNPQRLDLHAWFDAHLAFLIDADTRVSERPMTRARAAGILLEQPPSAQAPSQSIAVLAMGDQVVRVSGINPEGNPSARAMFERVIEQLEPEVTR